MRLQTIQDLALKFLMMHLAYLIIVNCPLLLPGALAKPPESASGKQASAATKQPVSQSKTTASTDKKESVAKTASPSKKPGVTTAATPAKPATATTSSPAKAGATTPATSAKPGPTATPSSTKSATSSTPAKPASTAAKTAPGSTASTSNAATTASTSTLPPVPAFTGIPGSPISPATEILLPNGLKIVLLEDHAYPVVACMSWYKAGALNEAPGSCGISHLVEHLLFGPVGGFKKGEIGATIARFGGQFNGFTSDDFTTFYEILPSSQLELALKIESARLNAGDFNDAQVQEEISKILTECESMNKSAQSLLTREVRAVAFLQHPYHNPPLGWKTDLEHLDSKMANSYYKQYFRPTNATIVLVGDFSKDRAKELLNVYFASIQDTKPKDVVTPAKIVEGAQRFERRVSLKLPVKEELVQIAYHAPALSEQDAPAMAILEKILSGGVQAKLYSKLVGGKLATSVSTSFEAKREPGLFIVNMTIPVGGTSQKAIEACDGIFNGLKFGMVNDAELKRACNQAVFSFWLDRDGPYKAAFQLGYFDVLANWGASYKWTEKLRSVKPADVQRVCKRYLLPEARVIGTIVSSTAQPKSSPHADSTSSPTKSPQSKQGTAISYAYYNSGQADVSQSAAAMPSNQVTAQAENVSTQVDSSPSPSSVTAPIASPQSVSAQPPSTAQKDFSSEIMGKKISSCKLRNGIQLVVLENNLTPVVKIIGSVRAGDVYDSSGKKGLSQTFVEVLKNGSAKRSMYAISQAQEDIGVVGSEQISFSSNLNDIGFQTKCLTKDLIGQLSNLTEIMLSPNFNDADVEKAKQNASRIVKNDDTSAEAKLRRTLLRAAVAQGNAYYPSDPLEMVKSISALKSQDLKDFYAKSFCPSATTIVLVGNINLSQARQILESSFASWQDVKTVASPPAIQLTGRQALRSYIPLKDRDDSAVCYARFINLDNGSRDYGKLLLSSYILSKHPIFSRLHQALMAEPSLNDLDNLNSEMNFISNKVLLWSLSVPADASTSPAIVDTFGAQLKKFARVGISRSELIESKLYLLGFLPVKYMRNADAAAKTILDGIAYFNDPDCLTPVIISLKAATVEGTNNFIRQSFKPEQASLVVLGDGNSIRAVRNRLVNTAR